MRATELKKRYPEIWNEVYEGMVTDLLDCMPKADATQYFNDNTNGVIARLAHNAAFLACDAVRINKRLLEIIK